MLVAEAWQADLDEVERHLAHVAVDAPRALAGVVNDALAAPGKRVRPRVAVLAYRACGGTDRARAVEAAVAVELLHTGTLLVDDVVDASPMRRGRPAPWTTAGASSAVLAAGWLVARAARVGAPSQTDAATVDPDEALEQYAHALQALEDVVTAEARALEGTPVTPPEWTDVARGKTAALFALAAEGGARKARRADFVPALRQYGTYLGLAFQARDDVLDWTGDADVLGKPARQDADAARPNLVAAFHGDVRAAEAHGARFAHEAVTALADLPDGPARDALAALARETVTRAR